MDHERNRPDDAQSKNMAQAATAMDGTLVATSSIAGVPDPRNELSSVGGQGNSAGGWIVTQRPRADGLAPIHNGKNATRYCLAWIAPNKEFSIPVATNCFSSDVPRAATAWLSNYWTWNSRRSRLRCRHAPLPCVCRGHLVTKRRDCGIRSMNSTPAPQPAWQGNHLHINRLGSWEYVSRNTRRPAVGIVAVHDDSRVILVEQYRPPIAKKLIELPAGLAGDGVGEEDEALLIAAQRELLEETGYHADRWRQLVSGYSSPGLTDESIVLFLAQDLTKVAAGGGVAGESIEVHEIEIQRVLPWLDQRGQSADLKLLAGLFAAQQAME